MITQRAGALRRWVPALVVAGALLAIYGVTLAPGLTWLHHGADGGDLIAAAAGGGVAHPTGYPAYLLLLRLALAVPVGSPALRANTLSAVCSALAAAVVADVVRLGYPGKRGLTQAAGMLAGFALGLSPLLWSQAVITEVYALHALLAALSLRALPIWGRRAPPARAFGLWGLVTGVALANHLTSALLIPVGLVYAVGNGQGRPWRLLWAAAGLAGGAALYLLLPLWASGHPPINWGNAARPAGLWWVISGGPYHGLLFTSGAFVLPRLRALAAMLLGQFGIIGLLLALAGLIAVNSRPQSAQWALLWVFASFAAFAVGYNTADSDAYLIPSFVAFAIWMGWGVAAVLDVLRVANPWWQPVAVAALVLATFANAIPAMAGADASRNREAEAYGEAVLRAAPPGAIIVTAEDRDTFALWYEREAAQSRRDVTIVVESLLGFDWYRESLRWTYPNLQLPAGGAANVASSLAALNGGPVCRTVLDSAAVLNCDR
ncbi:MAG: DUF2723 domain-containing protein [Chloroflexi bacterium]|nr:DUF2723 domain-containing protein [Chloroflexota bacterium]